jgi:polyhydroxyalkanoate synthesis regulator phasin
MEDKFFDRKPYLEIIEKRVSGLKDSYRQNIAIIGDENIGKTSIIFKFLNRFFDNRIIILYLEIRKEPIANFARRFIGVLLYNFMANSGITLKEDVDYLIEKTAKFIPRTAEKIKLILNAVDKRKRDHIFTDLLQLCELIKQETNKSSVVIFDEFHNLEELGIKNLYREWSKILISQKSTMYIIISSMKFKTKAILSKNLSLLFGNFEVIQVEPFDIKTCELYLDNKLQGINFNQGLRDFIIHFTGGYPLYLELISDALLKQKENNLVDVLENLLFDSCGILNQKFSNIIRRFLGTGCGNDFISIMYLISNGRNKVRDLMHIMHKTNKELTLRINHLQEVDCITKSGDFLKINDRVFGSWLKFVYQEKQHSLTFDDKNQKQKFSDNIRDMMQDYFLSAKRPVEERITEILRLFENEVVQLERKKIKLNHFREIKPLEFSNLRLSGGLIGRSNESLWIMAFKNDLLTEEDITDFARECKKYSHKQQRKIIVTLKGLDSNARLRALEEKIWTWDINNLNQIFDLFSKPWLVA